MPLHPNTTQEILKERYSGANSTEKIAQLKITGTSKGMLKIL